jgi:hypothetical protein
LATATRQNLLDLSQQPVQHSEVVTQPPGGPRLACYRHPHNGAHRPQPVQNVILDGAIAPYNSLPCFGSFPGTAPRCVENQNARRRTLASLPTRQSSLICGTLA